MLPRTRLVTINLAEYRGPQPQHHGSAREERSAKPPPRSSGGAFRCGPSAPTPLCHTSTRAKSAVGPPWSGSGCARCTTPMLGEVVSAPIARRSRVPSPSPCVPTPLELIKLRGKHVQVVKRGLGEVERVGRIHAADCVSRVVRTLVAKDPQRFGPAQQARTVASSTPRRGL